MKTDDTINQQQIDEWKNEYGRIFKTTVGEYSVIWRKLRRKEYVFIMSDQATQDIEGDKVYARQDLIVSTATLFPENIKELIDENAGLATSVADEIILKSGFNLMDTEEL